MKRVLVIFCMFFCVIDFSFAQIRGVIISSETQEPIVGAGVYVSNTSFGTFSDINGNFSLTQYPENNFILNFSSVGYETQKLEISPSAIEDLYISLTPKVLDIEAVLVVGERENLWEEYGDFFFELFIGYSKLASDCKIQNEDDIYFDYNESERILTATATQPIKINNKKLGYSITYWLEDFKYEYNTGKLYFSGTPVFEEISANKRIKKQREKAYQGSFLHFVHSIYDNKLNENGFLVNSMKRRPLSELYPPESKSVDTIDFSNSKTGISKIESFLPERNKNIFLNRIFEWKTNNQDSLYRLKVYDKINSESVIEIFEFWDKDGLLPNQTILTRYKENKSIEKNGKKGLYELVINSNIKQKDFVINVSETQKALNFDDFLQVYFLFENEEYEYQQKNGKEIKKQKQYSVISIIDVDKLLIYRNGLMGMNFDNVMFGNPYQLLLEYYWPYEKLDKMLPLDYKSVKE